MENRPSLTLNKTNKALRKTTVLLEMNKKDDLHLGLFGN